jgi:arylsulfatase A-like enzyme
MRISGVKQTPGEGTSLVDAFNDAKVPTKHTTQYFEMIGNRDVYHNGWVACTTPVRLPWEATADPSPDDFKWELYHVTEDFAEANNLAAANREKLKELQAVFDREAKRSNVLPLNASVVARRDFSIRPCLMSSSLDRCWVTKPNSDPSSLGGFHPGSLKPLAMAGRV